MLYFNYIDSLIIQHLYEAFLQSTICDPFFVFLSPVEQWKNLQNQTSINKIRNNEPSIQVPCVSTSQRFSQFSLFFCAEKEQWSWCSTDCNTGVASKGGWILLLLNKFWGLKVWTPHSCMMVFPAGWFVWCDSTERQHYRVTVQEGITVFQCPVVVTGYQVEGNGMEWRYRLGVKGPGRPKAASLWVRDRVWDTTVQYWESTIQVGRREQDLGYQ